MEPNLDSPAPFDAPAWARIVAFVGVPSVIAFFLVWFLASVVSTKLDAVSELRTQQEVSHFLLRAICINTAKTDGERAACELGR